MAQILLESLQRNFGKAIHETESFRGDEVAMVARERLVEICRWLRDAPECDCNILMELCGVDFPERKERFEVVYILYSTTKHHRVRLKVRVQENDATIDTVTGIWPGANWFERECFDLFGIRFAGHPHLKRLLTFEEFEGHPLRKDYPVNRRPKIPSPDPLMH
jgi:NADH-quinone oxidoreductase subunit C